MGPNGLVPSLLVFITVLDFPTPSQTKPTQAEGFEALRIAISEMETIATQNQIKISIPRKLPSAEHCSIHYRDKVRVYIESTTTWIVLYEVKNVFLKMVSVTDVVKMKYLISHEYYLCHHGRMIQT